MKWVDGNQLSREHELSLALEKAGNCSFIVLLLFHLNCRFTLLSEEKKRQTQVQKKINYQIPTV